MYCPQFSSINMYLVSKSISSLVEKLQVKDTTLESPYTTAYVMSSRQTKKSKMVLYAVYFDQRDKELPPFMV